MIKTANTVVVLWNGQYINNEWCLKELEYAYNQQAKTQNPSRIVLITLDETEVPDKFSDVLRLSGQDRGQREQAIRRLLKEEVV
jgi:hypothetical protein